MSLPPKLAKYIEQQTNPNWTYLICKFATIQLVTSLVTLSLCPQFGISPLGGTERLRELFMLLGHHWCDLLCGLFYALSFFIGFKIMFNPFEARKLSHPFWIGHLLILVGSLGLLALWGVSHSLHLSNLTQSIQPWWLIGYFFAYLIAFLNQQKSTIKFQSLST